MNLIILRNDYNGQVLPISEGITETRANLNLARKITWQHDTHEPWRQHEWQQFTTRSKSRAGSYLALVSSSMRMPWWTHSVWPDTILNNIQKESNSATHEISYAPVHNSNLLIGARRSVLNWHRRAIPPWSSEYQIRPLILLPIQYSPFSPNFPVQSPIMPTIRSSC
jgi:hypothetical protein